MSRKRKDRTRGGFLKLKDTKEYVESRQLSKEGYLQEVRVELGGNGRSAEYSFHVGY